MKKLFLISITTIILFSCSKEQRLENRLAGKWYLQEKIIDGIGQNVFQDSIFYIFDEHKMAGSATIHGRINSGVESLEFTYEIKGRSIIINHTSPAEWFDIDFTKTSARLTSKNGNFLLLNKIK